MIQSNMESVMVNKITGHDLSYQKPIHKGLEAQMIKRTAKDLNPLPQRNECMQSPTQDSDQVAWDP